ncbi:MAG: acetyl-CoA synthase subunit gamma [Spirochaetes bacterium]|nr:acetyl-CoA synthase subunit gamma [Spirochaetota bacterium]
MGCSCSQGDCQPLVQVSTKLNMRDHLGSIGVRFGIKRMKYRVNPGLYAVGNPHSESEVLVTANYKLTFDALRSQLSDLNIWILVLDTKGVNVWCAAGKGTFGTEELINRIQVTDLKNKINHNRIILPQLGAPGVAGHEVKKTTGMKVIYGPVYARDIKKFLQNQLVKSEDMKKINFTFQERLVLTPIEFVGGLKILGFILLGVFILSVISQKSLNFAHYIQLIIPLISAYMMATILLPLLLPALPFRAFSLKGALVGIILAIGLGWYFQYHWLFFTANLLIIPALSALILFNFTGATTFTSLSGVMKEMKIANPLMLVTIIAGIVFEIIYIFKGGL